MRDRIALIYHEPGDPTGYRMMAGHARRLSEALGTCFEPITIKEYTTLSVKAYTGAIAYVLFRGGHYYEIARKSGILGIPLYTKIPLKITAQGICNGLKNSDCSEAYLIVHSAKKYRDIQNKDINHLINLVKETCGAKLKTITKYKELDYPSCIISTTLLPSKHKPKTKTAIPYLINLISDHMIEHIKNLFKKKYCYQ